MSSKMTQLLVALLAVDTTAVGVLALRASTPHEAAVDPGVLAALVTEVASLRQDLHRMRMAPSPDSGPQPAAGAVASAAPGVRPAVAEGSATPAPLTAEQEAALTGARGVVDDAIARGRLAEDQLEALRQLVHQLPPEQAGEVRQALIVALNRREVVPDVRPFFLP